MVARAIEQHRIAGLEHHIADAIVRAQHAATARHQMEHRLAFVFPVKHPLPAVGGSMKHTRLQAQMAHQFTQIVHAGSRSRRSDKYARATDMAVRCLASHTVTKLIVVINRPLICPKEHAP
jgi:hypothetical protein